MLLLSSQRRVFVIQQLKQDPNQGRKFNYAESGGGMWDSEEHGLLDPKVIEPAMYVARPGSDAGWGFHSRAELLNGRLAMLGFVIGLGLCRRDHAIERLDIAAGGHDAGDQD